MKKSRKKNTNPNDVIMCEHISRGYWYWSSILSEVYAQLQTYTDISDEKIISILYDYMMDTAAMMYTDGIAVMETGSVIGRIGRAIRSQAVPEGPQLYSYVTAAFAEDEARFRKEWEANVGAPNQRGYAKDRKALVEWLSRFIEDTDSDGLFLTECISIDDHSQAVARLYERLDAMNQADDEAVQTGTLVLMLYALRTAMQVDSVAERLSERDDFVIMLKNTLAEYRNVETVVAHTWDIYRRDYTDRTGGLMMLNAYKILVAKLLLDGDDHVYEPYEEALRPVLDRALAAAKDIGSYRNAVFDDICDRHAVYDMAHPMALRFYTGAMMRPLTDILDFEGICRLFFRTDRWTAELSAAVSEARRDSERDRYIRGDFTLEHLYNEGDATLAGICSGDEFEAYLQNIFSRLGYDAQLTNKAGGDQGGDLILKKQGISFVVQAKFYGRPVGNKAVQEVAAAVRYYAGNGGIVVTNSTYTKQAQSLARKTNVILIDGDALRELIKLAYSEKALTHMF